MTVYVAMEEWTNCEDYEDNDTQNAIIGIFSSMEKAKEAVDKIVADRVRLVKEKNPNIPITMYPNEDSDTLPGVYCEVCFDYRTAGEFCGPFGTYTFGTDHFEYDILELKMDSSKTVYNLNGGVLESKD